MNARASKSSSPAVAIRAAIMAAFGARGDGLSNLWLLESYRAGRKWALRSDSEFIHAVLAEIDPRIRTINLAPEPVIVRVLENDHQTTFDAIIEFVDGRRECREIKTDPDEEPDTRSQIQKEAQAVAVRRMDAEYVRMYGTQMIQNPQRFWNGVRILRFVNAAKTYPLEEYRESIATRLQHSRRELTLLELCAPFEPATRPLASAAAMQLFLERHITLDLDVRPFNEHSPLRWAQ